MFGFSGRHAAGSGFPRLACPINFCGQPLAAAGKVYHQVVVVMVRFGGASYDADGSRLTLLRIPFGTPEPDFCGELFHAMV